MEEQARRQNIIQIKYTKEIVALIAEMLRAKINDLQNPEDRKMMKSFLAELKDLV